MLGAPRKEACLRRRLMLRLGYPLASCFAEKRLVGGADAARAVRGTVHGSWALLPSREREARVPAPI